VQLGNTWRFLAETPEPVCAAIHLSRDGIWFEEQLMSSFSYRSSRPDAWIHPRPHQDASLRYMKHGPIQPMEEPGFLARLLGRY